MKSKNMIDLLSFPRALILSPLFALFTAVMSIVVVSAAFALRSRHILDLLINRVWSRVLLAPIGVTVEVRGLNKVPMKGKGFLILFNHSSLVDIPILFFHFPRSFRFGAKIELFRVPFFGSAMKAVGILPIDRDRRKEVMKVYQQAIARVEKGECFALAPEGTRQLATELGPFKKGPFEFAINARMDILPVVIAGALDVLPRGSVWVNRGLWQRKIIVQVLDRVSAHEYSLNQLSELQSRVRAAMAPTFVQLSSEVAEINGRRV